MKSFLKSYWPLLLLIGLVVLFLGDVCFGGKMLLLRDFFNGDLWSRVIAGNAIRSGRFPLWCSLFGGGFPFPANPYMGECYPFTWFFALPSMENAIRLYWVFHLSVGAISFYLLLRHWRLEIAPALFGAVSFIFSTFVIAWLEFAQAITCMVWGPAVLLLVSLILERSAGHASKTPMPLLIWRNCGLIAALAVFIALQILTSGEFFYYTVLFAAAYTICRWVQVRNLGFCLRSLLLLTLAGLLGAALALPHLFSAMELLPYTDRVGEVDTFSRLDSAHPRHFLSFILPFLFGRPGYPAAYWAKQIYEFAFGACYAGVLPLLGLFFGVSYFAGKNPRRDMRFLFWFLAGTGAVSMLMSMGEYIPFYALIHHYVPGFSHFRYPTKFFLFTTYAVAALGAIGFQAVCECRQVAERRLQKKIWFGLLIFTGVVFVVMLVCQSNSALTVLMRHPAEPAPEQFASVRRDLAVALLFSLSASVLFGLALFERLSLRWLQAGIVAVAFLNLWLVSRQIQSTLPGGIYANQPDSITKRLSNDPQYRVWTSYSGVAQYLYGEKRPDILEWARQTGGVANDWSFHGISIVTPVGLTVSRYNTLATMMERPPNLSEAELKQLADYKKTLDSSHQADLEQIQRLLFENKLADMLSIRQCIAGESFDRILWQNASREIKVVERSNALPRAFLISQWRTESDDDALRVIASDGFDPHREAIVTQGSPEQAPIASPDAPGAGDTIQPVTSFVDKQESVVVTATAAQRSLLVLGDNWFPGWTATVDGVRKPIYRANYAFRGVFLDPGRHEVKFTYTPGSFRAGVALGTVAIIVTASLGVIPFVRPAPASPSAPEPMQEAAAAVAWKESAKQKSKKKSGKRKK